MSTDTKKPGKVSQFFKDVKMELTKRIVWPDFKQIVNNTGIVIVCVLIMGVFISLLDWGLVSFFNLILK